MMLRHNARKFDTWLFNNYEINILINAKNIWVQKWNNHLKRDDVAVIYWNLRISCHFKNKNTLIEIYKRDVYVR